MPAENLIGELNEGWRVATGSLGHERAFLWLGYSERLDDLVERGGQHADRPRAWRTMPTRSTGTASSSSTAKRCTVLGHRTLAKVQKGMIPAEQSILKLLGSEAVQRRRCTCSRRSGPTRLDPTIRSAPLEPLNLDVWTERRGSTCTYARSR